MARTKRCKTAGGGGYRGSVTGEEQWPIGPQTAGRGIPRPRPSDAAGQSVDFAGRWARKTAGNGQVSGAVAHVSKRRCGAQWEDAIAADRTQLLGTGDPRSTAGRSAKISVVFLVPYPD